MLNKVDANDYGNAVDKYNDKKIDNRGTTKFLPSRKTRRGGPDITRNCFFSGDANM